MRLLRLIFPCLALLGTADGAAAIDDGPRGYMLAPEGIHAVTLMGIFQEGNQSFSPGTVLNDAEVDINLGLLQYTHPLTVGGNVGALFAILPFGEVTGTLDTDIGALDGSSSGIGDIILGGVVGLVGSPALPKPEWAVFDPGLSIGLLGKVYAPTGAFDSDKVINLGADRWVGQIGLPIAYYFADSMLDPALTTFELLPSVTFFEEANGTAQDPIFALEGHVTRNFGSRLWGSVDALYVYGGETATDGVSNGDVKESFALGGTLGVNVSPSLSLKFSYGEFIYNNADGLDGRSFRMVSTFAY